MAKVNAVKVAGKGRAVAGSTPAEVLQGLFAPATPSASKLLKYMGANGYTRKQATAVTLHLLPTTSGSTIGCQYYSGRALVAGNVPTHAGKPAAFTPQQAATLAALCNQLTGTAPAPVAAPAKQAKQGKASK